MEYNVMEDLKNIKENISVMELYNISQQKTLFLKYLKEKELNVGYGA
jgi:hypothetical protein